MVGPGNSSTHPSTEPSTQGQGSAVQGTQSPPLPTGRMRGRRQPGKATITGLQRLREFAAIAILSVFGLSFLITELIALSSDLEGRPYHLLAIVRLVAVVLLLVAWWYGTGVELKAFEDLTIDDWSLVPPLPGTWVVLASLAALALAGMGLSYFSATLFAVGFVALKTVELSSSWFIQRNVRRASERARREYPDDISVAEAATAVEKYYLKRPWVILASSVLLVGSICSAAAAYSEATPAHDLAIGGLAFSSLTLLGTIVAQELVTFRWRSRYVADLDQALRE